MTPAEELAEVRAQLEDLRWRTGSSVKWLRRWRCHHSVVCCQYVDLPTCNSPRETHHLGRWAWRRQP